MSGRYQLDGDTLTVKELAITEIGCDKPLMDQDSWLADLIQSGLHTELDGNTLTLTGGGVTLDLTDRRVVDPDRPLQGTTWRLDGIITGTGSSAAVSSVPQGITATLRIADGKIHFFDGLNDYDGPVGPGGALTVGPDTVTIHGDIAGSAVGCVSTCSVDMSMLTKDFHYQITADRLTVTGMGSTAGKGLMFVMQDDTGHVTANPPHVPATPLPAGSGTTGAPTSVPGAPASGGSQPPATGGSDGTGAVTAISPAEPGPGASPGAASQLTSGVTSRPTPPGRHDSVPPQPSPAAAPESAQR
jgi:hypothetical protein